MTGAGSRREVSFLASIRGYEEKYPLYKIRWHYIQRHAILKLYIYEERLYVSCVKYLVLRCFTDSKYYAVRGFAKGRYDWVKHIK